MCRWCLTHFVTTNHSKTYPGCLGFMWPCLPARCSLFLPVQYSVHLRWTLSNELVTGSFELSWCYQQGWENEHVSIKKSVQIKYTLETWRMDIQTDVFHNAMSFQLCLFQLSLLNFRWVIKECSHVYPCIIKCFHLRDPFKNKYIYIYIVKYPKPPRATSIPGWSPQKWSSKRKSKASSHCKASRQGCRNTVRVSWITSGFWDVKKWQKWKIFQMRGLRRNNGKG